MIRTDLAREIDLYENNLWMKLEKTGPKINYYSHSAACTIQYIYWGFEEADIAYSLVLLSILFNTCAATGGRHFWKTFKNRLEKQQNGCFKLLNSILAVVHTYRQKKAHNTVFSQKKKLSGKKYLQPLKFSFSCIWFTKVTLPYWRAVYWYFSLFLR